MDNSKTRLAQEIGWEKAKLCAKAFLLDVMAKFSNKSFDVQIAFYPSSEYSFFEKMNKENIFAQEGNDMGERMFNAFNFLLRKYEKVVLMGTDIPHIPVSIVDRAFKALENTNIAIGPSKDGGYNFIGMGSVYPIFSLEKWSHEKVLEQTLALANVAELSFSVLDTFQDIDTKQDFVEVLPFITEKDTPNTWAIAKKLFPEHNF